jgi:hypothetical protein
VNGGAGGEVMIAVIFADRIAGGDRQVEHRQARHRREESP